MKYFIGVIVFSSLFLFFGCSDSKEKDEYELIYLENILIEKDIEIEVINKIVISLNEEIETLRALRSQISSIVIENEYMDIEGIYIDRHGINGLKIELLKDGNYKFTHVSMLNNELFLSEERTVYEIKKPGKNPSYLYYWYTGLHNNIPGSNSIIAYNITINGMIIDGIYFFTENPNSSADGTFRYIKDN